jgi:hypothetical protein
MALLNFQELQGMEAIPYPTFYPQLLITNQWVPYEDYLEVLWTTPATLEPIRAAV